MQFSVRHVMAIYHVHSQILSKKRCCSVIAAAAYRSASKLVEYSFDKETKEITEKVWDYTRKKGLVYSEIFAPALAATWMYDREELWNKIQLVEKRKDAQLAREFDIALPIELTKEQNYDLIKEMIYECFVKRGMIADVNVHYDNPNNSHLHVMLSMRDLVKKENGIVNFGLKNRSWNSKEFLLTVREQVAYSTNKHLEMHGFQSRISHLSHKARDINLTPTIHVGRAAIRIDDSQRKEENLEIIKNNARRIISNPELVLDKLEVNNPVFTKDQIAIELSKALLEARDEYGNKLIDKSKKITESLELLNSELASEFMICYSTILNSKKLSLVIEEDLKGRTLYAKTSRLALEKKFINLVHELNQRNNHQISISAEQLPNKEDLKLNSEQKKAIIEILAGSDISVLEGLPGAGKTTVMKQIVKHYKKNGRRVLGTAPSSSAALNLASLANIEAKNSCQWRKTWQKEQGKEFELELRTDYYKEEQGGNTNNYNKFNKTGVDSLLTAAVLTKNDVLIIDEASMIELADMDYLLSEAKKVRAKVILLGDNNQFAAVKRQGAFKKISEIASVSKLEEVKRQQNPEHKKATILLSKYEVAKALEIYQNQGCFNIHHDTSSATSALIKDYIEAYLNKVSALKKDDLAAIKSVVICAYTNDDVSRLNQLVRKKLQRAGIVKAENKQVGLGKNMLFLSKGEQIVFERNDTKLDILNGETGTVLEIIDAPKSPSKLIKVNVQKADGTSKVVDLDTSNYNAINYGYAVTAHKLQGVTVDESFIYYTPIVGYEAFNVMMTRHRDKVSLYGVKSELEEVIKTKISKSEKEQEISDSAVESDKSNKIEYLISAKKKVIEGKKQALEEAQPWFLGLTLAVSRRANLNLACDYSLNLSKSVDQTYLVVKEYLEHRQKIIETSKQLDLWSKDQYKFTASRISAWKAIRIMKDLSRLEEQQKILKENKANQNCVNKIKLIDPWKNATRHKSLWNKIPTENLELLWKLKNKFEQHEKIRRQKALIIYENYDNFQEFVDQKTQSNALGFKNLLSQLNINLETVKKHANKTDYLFFAKEIQKQNTICVHKSYSNLIKICDQYSKKNTARKYQQEQETQKTKQNDKLLDNLIDNLEHLKDDVFSVEAELLKVNSSLADYSSKLELVNYKIESLEQECNKLLPEFISRIYKTQPEKVLDNWNQLVRTHGVDKEKIETNTAIDILKSNPKVIGEIKGAGVGAWLGFSYINAADKEYLAERLKNYTENIEELKSLKKVQIEILSEENCLNNRILQIRKENLEQALPSKIEKEFLYKLDEMMKAIDDKIYNRNISKNDSKLIEKEEITKLFEQTLTGSTAKAAIFDYNDGVQAINAKKHLKNEQKIVMLSDQEIDKLFEVKEIAQLCHAKNNHKGYNIYQSLCFGAELNIIKPQEKNSYIGKIIAMSEKYIIQTLSNDANLKEHFVIHNRKTLNDNNKLVLNKELEISYPVGSIGLVFDNREKQMGKRPYDFKNEFYKDKDYQK